MLLRPPGPRLGRGLGGAFLVVYAVLLFARLGHYALWDDEANTALFGEGVWRTGDTNAVIGHNVIAYRSGLELQGLKNRLIAPLPYFWVAPFVGLFGHEAWAVRAAFTVFGLATAAFVLWWLRKQNASLQTWLLVMLGWLGNVSLILYARQCRYYPIAAFLTVLAAYFYWHRDGSWRRVIGLAVSAGLLLPTHYLAYAGFAVAIGVDYLVFGLWTRRYSWKAMSVLVVSQGVVGGAVVSIWNPLSKAVTSYVPLSWWADKFTLWQWNFRDLNTCEFGMLVVILTAPVLFLLRRPRDTVLVRIPLALAAYAAAVAVFSPQPVGWAKVADIRYMAATIPGCIWLAVRWLEMIPLPSAGWRVLLGLGLFETNVAQVAVERMIRAPFTQPLRSTLWSYLGELRHPPQQAYREAVTWVRANVKAEQSVYVVPEFGSYPLMFHAPQAIYAWQFAPELRATYPSLPDIHFKQRALPDYFLAFGGEVRGLRPYLQGLARAGYVYREVAQLAVHGADLTRPELYWRSFETVPVQSGDGVFVFARE